MSSTQWPDWLQQAITYAQQHQDGIRNTFATLAALVSLLVALVRLRTGHPTVFDSVRRLHAIDLGEKGHGRYWELRRDHPSATVEVLGLFVGNSGRQAIKREDFDGVRALELGFPRSAVQHCEVGSSVPSYLQQLVEVVVPDEHTVRIRPLLLNAGEAFELRVVCVGQSHFQQVRALYGPLAPLVWWMSVWLTPPQFTEDCQLRARAANVRRVVHYGPLHRALILLPGSGLGRTIAWSLLTLARMIAIVSVLFLSLVLVDSLAPGPAHSVLASVSAALSQLAVILTGGLVVAVLLYGLTVALVAWERGIGRQRQVRRDEQAHQQRA